MSIYKRLLNFVKPYTSKLILAVICMILYSALNSAIPFLVKPAMDRIFIEKNILMLKLIPIVVVIIVILKGLAQFGQAYLMSYVGLKVVTDIRDRLYQHIQKLSLAFFTKTPTGILISRITNDVNLIQGMVSQALTGVMKDAFSIIGLIAVVFYQKWDWALITFMIFPISIIPIVKFGKKIRKFSKKSQIKMGSITTLLHETISGNRIVKAFNMEDYESKRFSEENHRLFKIIMKRQTIRALSSPVMETLGGLGAALIILVGGMAVIKGKVTPGTFFSFVTALFMMYQPLKSISKMNNIIQEGMAAGKRVFEILDLKPGIHDKEGAIHLSGIKEGIEFKNVSFKYEDEWVLKDINFKVRRGETIALVGMSGGGKTTIANLIPRFYDIQHGTILIDGVDIRDYTIRSLRDNIAIVTQQTILFNDTVRNNIAYGNHEKNDEEVIKAAIAANAHDFILKLPKGYNTIIGEAGIKLSGGERQRISIARALLKDAPILILDEATSSLDTESEKEVQIALNNLMKNRTSIVIAHRLSTIRNADKIIVIENGKIVEKGTHEELLALKGYYKKLYDLQFVTQEKDSFENIVEKEMPRF